MLLGNEVVPIRGLGKGDLPRKSLIKGSGHFCKRRPVFHYLMAHWESERRAMWDWERELRRKSLRVSVGQVDSAEGGWLQLSLW